MHLHVHSNYSLLSSSASIEKIIAKAKDYKLNSIALTDTDGMYGLVKFAKVAIESNIKPIFGTTITDAQNPKKYVVLLAKNLHGYREICRTITFRKLNEDFSLKQFVSEYHENLFIFSPFVEYIHNFDNVFVELIAVKSEKKNNRNRYDFCLENSLRYIVTNPVYFMDSDEYDVCKVLNVVRTNKTMESIPSEFLPDSEYYFRPIEHLTKYCKKLPEALININFIIDNCNVDLGIGKYKFPIYKVPTGTTSYELLYQKSFEGLHKRFKQPTQQAIDRLIYELSVIDELHFTDYFLIVWDIVKEAHKRGMMIIGRGSAANSLVSYCLGFTQVDPLKLNLYFERFLNKGRSSPPDVDLDFSWKERDEIVRYVFDKYGYQNVAMISTVVTFRARSAFRETAKAFGLTNEEISKYSKFIPWTNAANLKNISELFPESRNLNFNIEPWKSIVDIAYRLTDFPRHLSIHPSGIVISPKPMVNYCALEYASNKGLGLIITQPDMYSIEDLGLIKIDLLSQRSLGVLRDTVDIIKKKKSK